MDKGSRIIAVKRKCGSLDDPSKVIRSFNKKREPREGPKSSIGSCGGDASNN